MTGAAGSLFSHESAHITINDRIIGQGHPCFLVAEAGVNHGGSVRTAIRMIDAAVEAKADAVKFQTFRANKLVTANAPKALYQRNSPNDSDTQLEMLKALELSDNAHYELSSYCEQRGITFLSTPFDDRSADLLNRMKIPAFKVSSGDLNNWPFLTKIASFGRPVILSTGMASLEEVADAYAVLEEGGATQIALLHCTSAYPTPVCDANLRAIQTLANHFTSVIGYSDHTIGVEVPLAAVALGASIVEKHFTLDRNLPGPDQKVSAEPHELKELIRSIRTVEDALGTGNKIPANSEMPTAIVARKSLVAVCDIPPESVLRREMIAIMRPGTGLPPSALNDVVGKIVRQFIAAGELITTEALK